MQMFRYLTYKELVQVAAIAETVELKQDENIFTAGAPGDAMYVVVHGSVKLVMGNQTVAELSRGQHFGEIALIDRSTRSLTAIAVEKSTLVVIHRKQFVELIKREPASGTKMLWSFVQVLGQRLRKTNADLAEALHGDKRGLTTENENKSQE
jgi:PPM family protein phosphatase